MPQADDRAFEVCLWIIATFDLIAIGQTLYGVRTQGIDTIGPFKCKSVRVLRVY
jgi:hypothetical protein